MIGDGGAREDNVTAIAPDYKRRNLYRAVPSIIFIHGKINLYIRFNCKTGSRRKNTIVYDRNLIGVISDPHMHNFTHFTRPSIALSDGDAIEAIYRLYAR